MNVDSVWLRASRGFTLTELITTVAVIAVGLAVAIPTWAGFAQRSEISTAANTMLTHLRYARTEALMRYSTISLCPSDDGQFCSADPFGWQRGYIVFDDVNNDRQRDAGEQLLKVQGTAPDQLQIHSTASRPAIRFRPDGTAWGTNTTFSVCLGNDASSYRAVVLLGTGRARVDDRAPSGPVRCETAT